MGSIGLLVATFVATAGIVVFASRFGDRVAREPRPVAGSTAAELAAVDELMGSAERSPDPRLREMAVGQMFETISHGYGVMPSYAAQVTPEDRWAIIAYIRALQLSEHATIADVPAADRGRLQ